MRKRVIAPITFLLLGAVSTFLVAWSCVLLSRDHPVVMYHNPRGIHPLVLLVSHGPGQETVTGCGRSGTMLDRFGPSIAVYTRTPWWSEEMAESWWVQAGVAAGWPMLAVSARRSQEHFVDADGQDDLGWAVHGGIPWNPHSMRQPPLALPFTPLWRGFCVNTLIYAILWWSVSIAWSKLRGFRTRAPGACAGCGYARGALEICPECGLPSHAVTPA